MHIIYPHPEKIASRRSLSLKNALLLLSMAVLLTFCGGVEEDPSKPKAWHVSTLAGGDSEKSPAQDGVGTAVSFLEPYGLALSGDTLYVSDVSFNTIRTVHTTTARVVTVVTGNAFLPGYRDGSGTEALLNSPSGIVTKDGNTLYIADTVNHRIRAVDLTSVNNTVSTVAGSGTVGTRNIFTGSITGGGYADGAGNAAQFNAPTGLAISGNTLYVADTRNNRIRAIDLASANKTVSTIAGNGSSGYANGTGTAAQFNAPVSLALSGTTLYVADANNHRIRAIDIASTNKTVSTLAGSGTPGYANGVGTAAHFNRPTGLAVSGNHVYVADRRNHRIRAIDIATKTVRHIAGDGIEKTSDGIGTAAQFKQPSSIAVSKDEKTIYVTSRKLIRKLEYREVD